MTTEVITQEPRSKMTRDEISETVCKIMMEALAPEIRRQRRLRYAFRAAWVGGGIALLAALWPTISRVAACL